MIQINIPPVEEMYNEVDGSFLSFKGQTIVLEHSLVSISKWEAKWHKFFFSKDPKTKEETMSYIKCMTITQNVNPNAYNFLSSENFNEINAYINDPMTATIISESKKQASGFSREQISSELIYYWMISLNIPFECQRWHINRLLTLIKICMIKNQPPKKMGKRELMARNHSLNAARRAKLGTKG